MSSQKLFHQTALATLLVLSGFPGLAWSDIATDILGTWQGPCLNIKSVNIKSSVTYMTRRKFEDKTIFYKDKGCSKPNGSVKTNKGTYRLGRRVRTPRGNTAYHIDVHVTYNRYNTMRLPQVRYKNIIRVVGRVLTAGQLTPRTFNKRPSKLALDIPFRRVR